MKNIERVCKEGDQFLALFIEDTSEDEVELDHFEKLHGFMGFLDYYDRSCCKGVQVRAIFKLNDGSGDEVYYNLYLRNRKGSPISTTFDRATILKHEENVVFGSYPSFVERLKAEAKALGLDKQQ